ncbi:transporter substrate-binding domain-containing protein [Vibrio viridaestus]|uniref:ABC transporter substrate-binding protein n=1 Tax=Vibrio viridaestus TaxID=2487322 RepID=A0A3N9TF32_9VIBR|nr:transporter substrate-binding domain-containing protein [Vibrio viridaestus]RQW62333.1 ABC transporter substrate-binding protein [Vibrio viridaestus]
MELKKTLRNILCVSTLFMGVTAAQADLLDDIKSKGEIVIATEARYAPFEMLENGKIVGYGKDILDAILQDLPGVKLKQLDLPFQGILAGLNAKRYDFVATSLMITQKRMDNYAFTNPIADASVAILKRKSDDSIKAPEDMAGKVIGVQAGSAQYTAVKKFEKDVLAPEGKSVKSITEFTDYNEAYAALASRRVDIVPQAIPNLAPIVKKRPDMFSIVQPPFGDKSYYGWAARKDEDSRSLVDFMNKGLLKLQKSGKLAELQMKWFGFTMDVPEGSLPKPLS